MIRVLQATAWYPPHHLGGTEVYLSGLVRGLRRHSIESRVVAPLAPQAADGYLYDGAVVRTYPVNQEPSRAELRRGEPHDGFERFCEILREERPDIYHQHSWTRGMGAHHLRAARELGCKTVLTVHTPNVICMRGTMMHFGEAACDGEVRRHRCAACWCQSRGSSKQVSELLATVPGSVGSVLERAGCGGRWTTALSARQIAAERQQELARIVENADRIVAVCQWLCDALARNGIPQEKLVLSRQGVDDSLVVEAQNVDLPRTGELLRLIYIGRWHPVKGLHLLVNAVCACPSDIPIQLVIHAPDGGIEERDYETSVRAIAALDPRIQFSSVVTRDRLLETLRHADALVVPSLWIETGPLVVLEAKAAGRPVIGSRLGGIAELVREPNDGILVEPNSVKALTQAIVQFARDYRMRNNTRTQQAIRSMSNVAEEMTALYRSLPC